MGLSKCCNCNGFQYPAVTVCMYENRAESIERFTQVDFDDQKAVEEYINGLKNIIYQHMYFSRLAPNG